MPGDFAERVLHMEYACILQALFLIPEFQNWIDNFAMLTRVTAGLPSQR